MKQTRYIVDRAGPLLPFLLERVKGGRNHVKGLLARGQVSVDGETVTRHDHPLSPGQVVEVFAQAPAEAPFPVLYEDGRILVVDKPAGLLTVASDGEKVRTAYRLAADYVGRRERGARVFIVHRLDRDTSGVLLFAKDEAVKRAYQEDWNGLVSRRGYLAVAEGVPPQQSGTVRTRLREKLKSVDKDLSIGADQKKPKKAVSPKSLKIGDGVRVLTMNLNGTVSTLPNAKGDFYVQMGILRSLVNIKDVELLDEPVVTGPTLSKTGGGKIKMSKSSSISPEVNLIGMTTDEALPVLDKYLDDAYLSHLNQVRVVHGRGTGALKAAVHKHLKKLKYVKDFRLGEFGEGDSGVTIVTFK